MYPFWWCSMIVPHIHKMCDNQGRIMSTMSPQTFYPLYVLRTLPLFSSSYFEINTELVSTIVSLLWYIALEVSSPFWLYFSTHFLNSLDHLNHLLFSSSSDHYSSCFYEISLSFNSSIGVGTCNIHLSVSGLFHLFMSMLSPVTGDSLVRTVSDWSRWERLHEVIAPWRCSGYSGWSCARRRFKSYFLML